ncbi:MAG: efflux RND transporter periplasmic adaptor subunit [bacterium]|nr:efflux RND transporter periplasmic adaptor subunit [bacterium]
MISNILKQILQYKFITGIVLLLIIGGGYFGYGRLNGDNNAARYATAAVEKGALIISVSGSGQVSASDQLDIKSKVKSDVVAVYVGNGNEVKAGKLIAKLDDKDFQKSVEDAEISLETAKLELEKLLTPDELSLLKAENALVQAKESKQKAENNIEKAYEDAFNTITNAFLDLPTITTGVTNALYGYEIAKSETTISDDNWNITVYQNSFPSNDRDALWPFVESAKSDYKTARENYDQNLENYKNTKSYSEKKVIEELLNQTIETTKLIARAAKSESNLLDFVVDYLSTRDMHVYGKTTTIQSDLKSYISKTNSLSSSLLSVQRSLQDNREAVVNAERSIEEKELSLAEIKAGSTELEIRAKKSAVQQKEDALIAAKQDFSDCYIYAPFDGIITDIKVKKGDSVSVDTTVANIITQQKIAEISLNEVDAAKVKVGQRATLTFDALSETSISGRVFEVDALGTVIQGVVSYGVKIAFDTQDERIKPGMSVTADIITDAKQDVLVLPSSAIKSQGGVYFVKLVDVPAEMRQKLLANISGVVLPNPPREQVVETGLSNDISTEIVSGLKEGDIVVTSTITSNKIKNTQTQSSSGFQMPGMGSQRSLR